MKTLSALLVMTSMALAARAGNAAPPLRRNPLPPAGCIANSYGGVSCAFTAQQLHSPSTVIIDWAAAKGGKLIVSLRVGQGNAKNICVLQPHQILPLQMALTGSSGYLRVVFDRQADCAEVTHTNYKPSL